MSGKVLSNVAHLLTYKKKNRGSVTSIADRLGNPGPVVSEWLILTAKENMPIPEVVSFPKPPKAADGSLMYERIPNKVDEELLKSNAATATVNAIVTTASHSPPPLDIAVSIASTISGTTSPTLLTSSAANSPSEDYVAAPLSMLLSNKNVSSSLKRLAREDSNGVDSKYCHVILICVKVLLKAFFFGTRKLVLCRPKY